MNQDLQLFKLKEIFNSRPKTIQGVSLAKWDTLGPIDLVKFQEQNGGQQFEATEVNELKCANGVYFG